MPCAPRTWLRTLVLALVATVPAVAQQGGGSVAGTVTAADGGKPDRKRTPLPSAPRSRPLPPPPVPRPALPGPRGAGPRRAPAGGGERGGDGHRTRGRQA